MKQGKGSELQFFWGMVKRTVDGNPGFLSSYKHASVTPQKKPSVPSVMSEKGVHSGRATVKV